MLNVTEFSVDDGATWLPIVNAVRVVFREVHEDDDEMHDLHMTVTHEGVIYDLVGRVSGLVAKTKAVMATDIPEELQ